MGCGHHLTIREFFTRFHQLTSLIDINHYSILPPQLGARLLRLVVLIILHQDYISPAKREIITLRTFIIQGELNTNSITKNTYRTKYKEEISRQRNQSVIIHRLTSHQRNKINSTLISWSILRPDTQPYQLSPLIINIRNHSIPKIRLAKDTQKNTNKAEERDKGKVTENSTEEAERKKREEERKKKREPK